MLVNLARNAHRVAISNSRLVSADSRYEIVVIDFNVCSTPIATIAFLALWPFKKVSEKSDSGMTARFVRRTIQVEANGRKWSMLLQKSFEPVPSA